MPDQPPSGDPFVIRLAAATLGISVVLFVVAIMVDVAVKGSAAVPTQFWLFGNTLAGALLGLLVPSPSQAKAPPPQQRWVFKAATSIWQNKVFLALLIVFVASAVVSDRSGSKELLSLTAASGGALLGLLAPSPKSSG